MTVMLAAPSSPRLEVQAEEEEEEEDATNTTSTMTIKTQEEQEKGKEEEEKQQKTTADSNNATTVPPPPVLLQKNADVDFQTFKQHAGQVDIPVETLAGKVKMESTTPITAKKMVTVDTDNACTCLSPSSLLVSNQDNTEASVVEPHEPGDKTTTTATRHQEPVQSTEPETETVEAATATVELETLHPPEDDDASENDNLHGRFVSPKDFELLKVIGMGAFGKVLQVRNRQSGNVLAMKVISKRVLKRKSGYVENVRAERDILTRVKSPFVVTMHCSFQSKEKLFIIMDFLAGGELFLRIGREGIFLEKTAAFYLAEIILALDHLHTLGILHRDLKPENILLGSDGHVCLTDFGLAKDFGGFATEEDDSRALTICGTQEYMAPEMLARKGYGRAADFWSLGCIAFEMLSGLPPFQRKRNESSKDLFSKIMSQKVKMPSGASAEACKLLKGLLNRNVQARLGTSKSTMFELGGVTSLKTQKFFAQIDWEKLEKKQVEPPEVLAVDNDQDLKHFHEEFINMTLPRSVVEMSGEEFLPRRVESDLFRGFSFIQEDFELPDRDELAVKAYWEAQAEGDGESVSDVASSKACDEGENEQLLTAQTPEKKKRPPRKRKKKTKLGDATGTASPIPESMDSPPPSEVGEKDEVSSPVKAEVVPENDTKQTTPSAPTVTAEPAAAEMQPSATNPTAVPVTPPQPQKSTWMNQAGGNPAKMPVNLQSQPFPTNSVLSHARPNAVKTTARPLQPVSKQEHSWQSVNSNEKKNIPPRKQQLAATSPEFKPSVQSGWSNVPQRQQQKSKPGWSSPPVPVARTAKPQQARGGGNDSRGWGPQQGRPSHQTSSAPPRPHAPLQTQHRQISTDSSGPSTDWRTHAMSPRSPRRVKNTPQLPPQQQGNGGGVVWPSLGDQPDKPHPPTVKPALANPPQKLKGAWASRK